MIGGGMGGTETAGAGGVAGAQPPAETACRTDQAPAIPALKIQTVVKSSALENATFAIQPPGSDDWYIVEQRGRIMIARNGEVLGTPFLDLSSEITLGSNFDQTTVGYDERGVSGLAFAPDYATSGLFYIAVTPSTPDVLINRGLPADHDLILEYRRSEDADRADTTVVRTLIDLPSRSAALGNIHNFNTVRFGPDGYLWIGSGDGGGVNCGDTENGASQNITKQFGKILRLDLSKPAPYGAADNPFADTPGAETVMHYGVRNPFRFNFDRATGDLYFGDVGQNTYEEQDFASASSKGLNFGWPTFEAKSACAGAQFPLRAGSTATEPIFVANRRGGGSDPFSDYRASVGGVVYRGQALPALTGTYVFGDYYGERLGALQQCAEGTSPVSIIRKNCDPNFPNEACLQPDDSTNGFGKLTAIIEDHAGEVYFLANGNSLLKLVAGN